VYETDRHAGEGDLYRRRLEPERQLAEIDKQRARIEAEREVSLDAPTAAALLSRDRLTQVL
jgi:hypothetical protein